MTKIIIEFIVMVLLRLALVVIVSNFKVFFILLEFYANGRTF